MQTKQEKQDPGRFFRLGKRLTKAVQKNDIEAARAALKDGANSFFVSDFFNPTTPFHFAAKNGNVDMLKLLLENKDSTFDPETLQQTMKSPLDIAAEAKQLDAMKFLLEEGFTEDKVKVDTNAEIIPPLPSHQCLLTGFVEGAKLLISDARNRRPKRIPGEWSDLHCYVLESDEKNVVETISRLESFEERRKAVNTRGPWDITPLHIAASCSSVNILRFLLENGGDVELIDSIHKTASHYACSGGMLENVKYLVENCGVKLTTDDNESYATALEIAIKFDRSEVVKYLLLEKKMMHLVRGTELYLASFRGALASARLLVEGMGLRQSEALKEEGGEESTKTQPRFEVLPVEPPKKDYSVDFNKCLLVGTDHPHIVKFLLFEMKADPNGFQPEQKGKFSRQAEDEHIFPLLRAIKSAPLETVELLVQAGADVNCKTDKLSALSLSIIMDRDDIGVFLISKGATIADTDLIYAIQNANDELAKVLVENGANINAVGKEKNELGQTPLMLCAVYNDLETMKLLLEKKADVHKVDAKGMTAIHYSVSHCPIEFTKLLVENGANVFVKGHEGTSLLHHASFGDVETAKYLVEKGLDPNARHKETMCLPLHNAILSKNFEMMEYFFSITKDKTARINNALTPIHLAAESLSPEMVKFLLEKGADPNSKAEYDLTPMHQALQCFKRESKKGAPPEGVDVLVEVLSLLFDAGGDVDSVDQTGASLLHVAVTIPQSLPVLQLMISRNANIEATNKTKIPVLTNACTSGNLEAVMFLVEAGAQVDPEASILPLGAACLQGNAEIVEFLLRYQADPNSVGLPDEAGEGLGTIGFSPIHLACHSPNRKVMELLIIYGADVNAITKVQKNTPLHLLAGMEASPAVYECQQLLLDNAGDFSLQTKNAEGLLPYQLLKDQQLKRSPILKATKALQQTRVHNRPQGRTQKQAQKQTRPQSRTQQAQSRSNPPKTSGKPFFARFIPTFFSFGPMVTLASVGVVLGLTLLYRRLPGPRSGSGS